MVLRDAWIDEDVNNAAEAGSDPKGNFKALTAQDEVWLPSNETKCAKPIAALEDEGEGVAICYKKDETFPAQGVNDMVEMKQLNDAELANNLRIKFKSNTGYVRCGPTLVAMNLMASYKVDWQFGSEPAINSHPFDMSALRDKFRDQVDRDSSPPHCWSLASHAFKMAFIPPKHDGVHDQMNQALIITGESGAGKTFTTQQILDFLAAIGGGAEAKTLTDKMLSTMPILEGWGNANMPRNPDSSRFGKLYKIYLSQETKKITGCTITPYMLEKSRVGEVKYLERNFHIFYRMLCDPVAVIDSTKVNGSQAAAEKCMNQVMVVKDGPMKGQTTFYDNGGTPMLGLSPKLKKMCHLDNANFEDFLYLMGGEAMKDEAYPRIHTDLARDVFPAPYHDERIYHDHYNMSETLAALYGFFDEATVETILKTTAGVLYLGNVDVLTEKPTDPDTTVTGVDTEGKSGEALRIVSELWQVDIDLLAKALTMYTLQLPRKAPTQHFCQRRGDAIILRDTVARFVYDGLFNHIIEQCSNQLKQGVKDLGSPETTGSDVFVGVLDIFGFEFYENHQLEPVNCKVVNGLDQLNINICNEVLQQVFVKVIFGLEQAEYKKQSIDFTFDGYKDNADTIAFLTPESCPLLNAMKEPIRQNKTDSLAADHVLRNKLDQEAKKFKSTKTNKPLGIDNPDRGNPDAVYLEFPTKGNRPFKGCDKSGGPYGNRIDPRGTTRKEREKWEGTVVAKEWQDRSSPAFGVRHYAAEVCYDVRGWAQKDKSNPADEMRTALAASNDAWFLSAWFGEEGIAKRERDGGVTGGGVTAQFSVALRKLEHTLQGCDMSFVRCIKASNPLKKQTFQSALVLKQLKYTGMLATLQIKRFGYPLRYFNQDFVDKYKALAIANNATIEPVDFQNGSDEENEATAARNAQAVAEKLETTFKQVIFDELKPAEQADDVVQKHMQDGLIKCGKHQNCKESKVMLRDWFGQRLLSRVDGLLSEKKAIAVASTKAAIHSKALYGKMSANARPLSGMLRSLVDRSRYYSEKREFLQKHSRTQMADMVRACLTRFRYAAKRNEYFEAANRQRAVGLLMATAQREIYKQKKAEYLEAEVLDQIKEFFSKMKTEIFAEANAVCVEAKEKVVKINAFIEEQSRAHVVPVDSTNAPTAVSKGPKVVRYFPLVKRNHVPTSNVSTPTNFKYTYNFECKSMASRSK